MQESRCGFRRQPQDKSGNAARTSHCTTGRVGKMQLEVHGKSSIRMVITLSDSRTPPKQRRSVSDFTKSWPVLYYTQLC
jgi:hypothetical protein